MDKLSYKITWFFVSLCLTVVIFSCKTKAVIPEIVASEIPKDSIFQAIENHNIDFEWFAAEGKAKYSNDEQSVGTKTYIRMKKDSVIWVVVKKLKVESNRVLITPDSFFILYRLQQKYEKGALQDLLDAQGISYSFSEIQYYMSGNVPTPSGDSDLSIIDNRHVLSFLFDGMASKLSFHPNDLTVDRGYIEDSLGQSLQVYYNDFRQIDSGQIIPFKREYSVDFGNGKYAKAQFEFSKVSIDVPKKTKFSIPEWYEEI